MNFNNSITFDIYANQANKQLGDMQSRLTEIENGLQTRMNGKTTSVLVGSFIGTVIWLGTFVACGVYIRDMVNNNLLNIAMIIACGLILFMIIDNIMDFSYYGKITSYKNSVTQLQSRVSVGKNAINSNYDAFMESRLKGWSCSLNAAPSIPEEALTIEETMTSMESLKKGFISSAKKYFFYATVVVITVVGCVALFSAGSSVAQAITDSSLSNDEVMRFNYIALIITVIGEVILARRFLSKTDDNVTNTTLFVVAIGPIAFLLVIAAILAIIWLVVMSLAVVVGLGMLLAIPAAIFFSNRND